VPELVNCVQESKTDSRGGVRQLLVGHGRLTSDTGNDKDARHQITLQAP
jgi:hypothetical protein